MATARVDKDFLRDLDYYTKAWLPVRDIVNKAYATRLEYDPKGRVMVCDSMSVP